MSATEGNKQAVIDVKKVSIWGRISIAFGIIGTLCILNFFLAIIPNNFQGRQLHMASEIGFIGLAFGLVDLIRRKEKRSLFGVIYNLILVIFPLAFWVVGTFIEALLSVL